MDEGDEAIASYARDEDEDSDGLEYKELDVDRLAYEVDEIDSAGITIAKEDRLKSNDLPETNHEDSGKFSQKV